ncbi:MAG: hypothetical protein HDS23_06710 [Bacteroides sp.]|nr:hypothetical protein [Bacteroides sp.]
MKLRIYGLIAIMLFSMVSLLTPKNACARELKSPTVNLITSHTRNQKQVVVPTNPFKATRRIPKIGGSSRVNSSGSNIFAMRISPQPLGLIDINYDGTETLKWEGDSYWFPTTGFIYDGKIYGISAMFIYGNMYVSRMDYTIASGEITYTEEVDNNPAHAAITAVYDPLLDEAYAYTYTEMIDGYVFNKLDPATFTFTPISNDIDQNDICLSMAYDEKRDRIVGLTSDSRLVVVDTKTGKGETLSKLPLSLAFYSTAMTYSPIDDAYVCQVIEKNMESSLLKIDATTYSMERTHVWPEEDIHQFMIMFSEDDVFSSEAPSSPSLQNMEVNGAALEGKMTVTMPDTYLDGKLIDGMMELRVFLDDQDYDKKTGLKAGETVTIPIEEMQEGRHVFSLRAVTDGKESPVLKIKRYFGYDTPLAPSNVVLEGNMAKWDAVTSGVENGYVEKVKYEVWLNGEKQGETANTSMEIELPQAFTTNEVTVYAISHGKVSSGTSSRPIAGGVLSLGTAIYPEEVEWPAFTVVDGDNDGNTWKYTSGYGISYRPEEETASTADEWVITPAYEIIGKGYRHILSFNADVDMYNPARIEILQGAHPEREYMKSVGIINLEKEFYGNVEHYFVPQSDGKCYIAFRLLDPVTIDICNIMLDDTEVPVTAPDDVTDLIVTPDPMGLEKAEVSFTLPERTIEGMPVKGKIPVIIRSDKETVETSALPGKRISVSLQVPEGLSRVTVEIKGGGTVHSDEFYAGVDMPAAPDNISYVVSEDNMTVTINWDKPTKGVHGGYIDPESITYEISLFDDDEGYIILEENYSDTTITHRLYDDAPQRAWYYYITAGNSRGLSEEYVNIPVAMGTPYTLPMEDYMQMGGKIGPLTTTGSEEYKGDWTISNPFFYDNDAGELEDFVVVGKNDSGEIPTKGSLILPKFNPDCAERIVSYMKFFFGDNTPDVALYALTSGGDKVPVLDIKAKDMKKGYQTVTAILPESINNNRWVQIAIEPRYEKENQSLIFVSYSIFGAYSHDAAVVSVDGSRNIYLGEDSRFDVTLRNDGFEDLEIPGCELEVRASNKQIAKATILSTPEMKTLKPGEHARFRFGVKVDNPANIGGAEVVARITSLDKNEANDEMLIGVSILAGDNPVVTDLNAVINDNGTIGLSWSTPEVKDKVEGFENCDPYLITPTLEDFTNIDGDGMYTTGYAFPYHTPSNNPTGWIIWDRETVENAPYNNNYLPFAGDRMLVALCPDFGDQADDWLISPRIAGGSEISFMMSAAMAGLKENLQIMVSEKSDNPKDFILLKEVSYSSENWKSFSIKLPETAKYFAIRYTSVSGCGILLDELSYVPALAKAVYTGYDIIRNGDVIAENVSPDCKYTDTNSNGKTDVYRVCPVYVLDGVTKRGLPSNEAVPGISGVSGVDSSKVKVIAAEGRIIVLNAMGRHLEVFTANGTVICDTECESDEISLPVASGVNLVSVDGDVRKVMVK